MSMVPNSYVCVIGLLVTCSWMLIINGNFFALMSAHEHSWAMSNGVMSTQGAMASHSWVLLSAHKCSWVIMNAHLCSWVLNKVYFKPKFPNDPNFKSCSFKQVSIWMHLNYPPISNRVNVSRKAPLLLKFQFWCDSLC